MDIKAIAVIGAGTMGSGIAQVLAASGIEVTKAPQRHRALNAARLVARARGELSKQREARFRRLEHILSLEKAA